MSNYDRTTPKISAWDLRRRPSHTSKGRKTDLPDQAPEFLTFGKNEDEYRIAIWGLELLHPIDETTAATGEVKNHCGADLYCLLQFANSLCATGSSSRV